MEFIRKSNFPKKVFHLHFDLIKFIYFVKTEIDSGKIDHFHFDLISAVAEAKS